MATPQQKWAAVAGVLAANSAPHLATAVVGRRHLTPLAGRNSSPAVNAVWGLANLVGGLALLRTKAGPAGWDSRLPWFEVGAAAMAAWMAATEAVARAAAGRRSGHRRRH
ncbi:hypothetical protein [Georgenia sp. MJ170]|uniref:hypothetical protein n=1 Tax=Georgenia sunbinii TaxID=3117728 RepID=UPI002F25F98A